MADKLLTRYGLKKAGSAKAMYKLRKLYLNTVVPIDKYSNFFDGSVRQFYGKVDCEGNVVYPSEKYLKPLDRGKNSPHKQTFVLNFVADAFRDLQKHINQAAQLGILNGEEALSNLVPTKAWESMHTKYGTNIESLYGVLISSYMEKPTQFKGVGNDRPINFDEFMKLVEGLFHARGKNFKLTRSSYVLSNFCPIHISGLAIEIAPEIDYMNDDKKNITYIENPNFPFYMNALKKFGFMADINYPGRIIADIGSQPMQVYMQRHGITFDTIFDTYFYKASAYDYDLVKIYLSQFYNNYVTQFPAKSISTGGGSAQVNRYSIQMSNFDLPTNTVDIGSLFGNEDTSPTTKRRFSSTELIRRKKLTDEDMANKYGDSYWLGVYARMLNFELGRPLDDNGIKKIIKNAINLRLSIDIATAIGYIDEKIRKYRYPLDSYNIFSTDIEPVEPCG